MNMSSVVIPAITILLGALPASLGYLFKVRRDQQRSAKRVLYYLLEIRATAIQGLIRPDSLLTDALSTLEGSAQRYDPSISIADLEMPEGHVEKMEEMFEELSNIRSASLPDQEPYLQALETLAEDYPVLAFNIRCNEYLKKWAEIGEAYNEWYKDSIQSVEGVPEPVRQAALKLANKSILESRTGLVDDIDADLTVLAKCCGWKSRLNVRAKLKHRPSFEPDDDLTNDVNSAFDEYMTDIHEGMKKQAADQKDEFEKEPAHV
jgi:hypothetical protein